MGVETVSSRFDGETPNADALNELLEELKLILVANGVPSTLLQWPLKASGPLDMNGYPIVNASSSEGVMRVNASNSLSNAISLLPSSGGTIVIDPGFIAETAATGEVIEYDNVSIISSGGGGIKVMSRSSSGPGIAVTGNNFTLDGVTLSCEVGLSNVTHMVGLGDVEVATITRCVFEDVYASALEAHRVSGHCTGITIANNRFTSGTAHYLDFTDINNSTISGNSMSGNTGVNIEMSQAVDSTMLGLTFAGNTITGGTFGIYSVLAPSNPSYADVAVTGNTIECDNCFYIYSFTGVVVTGNVFTGGATISGVDCVVSSNIFDGPVNVNEANAAQITGNFFQDTFVFDNSPSGSSFIANRFTGEVDFASYYMGLKLFTQNHTGTNFLNLTAAVIDVQTDNNADGVIT